MYRASDDGIITDELEAFGKDDEAIFVWSKWRFNVNQEGSMLIKNVCIF